MSARAYFEDVLSGLLKEAEDSPSDERFPDGLRLGVSVFPGRTNLREWPEDYVAVMADEEEPRSQGGVWLVTGAIWCVTSVDDPQGKEKSGDLARKLGKWFGPGCPAKGFRNAEVIIHGLTKGTGYAASADHSFADVLPIRCGIQVRDR